MTKEIKDTAEIVLLNGTAVGFHITECNEILTFVSLMLAISLSLFKMIQWIKTKK
tara:strand:- start:646 stop:810 length:165 start_codon:yes stop_codon:yes gene_type:complete